MAKLNWTLEEAQALTKEQHDALTPEERAIVRKLRIDALV